MMKDLCEEMSVPASLNESVEQGVVLYWEDMKRRAWMLTRNQERAEELVQDAVERALRFRDSFREGSQVRAWLMRIMHNLFISQLRRSKVERRLLEGARHDPNAWTTSFVALPSAGISPPVRRALDALPEKLERVVSLVDLYDYSYREAAEEESVPVGTVMSRLHRGRARLSSALACSQAA